MRIAGELTPAASSMWAVQGTLLIVGIIPVGVMSSMLIFVGVRSLANPAALGNLWECLGAGVAILGAYGLVLYQSLRVVPRRTIRSFELVDANFTCTTPRDGLRTYPVSSLRSVRTVYGGRGRRVVSWLIRFAGGKWVELAVSTSHAEQLMAALEGSRGRAVEQVRSPMEVSERLEAGEYRANLMELIGVGVFRLAWFGGLFAVAVWASVSLGAGFAPSRLFATALAGLFALLAGTLLLSEVRFLGRVVVWFEPTPTGFRCRLLGRSRIDEIEWQEIHGSRDINRGGRRTGPTGREYLTGRGRYIFDWWSLPQSRSLAAPGTSPLSDPSSSSPSPQN